MDAKKLMAVATLNGDTRTDLAKVLNIDPSSLSAKLHRYRGRSFSLDEIEVIIDRYGLGAEATFNIFFKE